jgi:glutaredoxin
VRVLTVYGKPDCHLCEQAIAALHELRGELSFELVQCDISTDDRLLRAYFERIPVGVLDGEELFEYFLDERILRQRLAMPEGGSAQRDPEPEHPLESAR